MSNNQRQSDIIAPWLVKAKVSPPRRNNTAFFRKNLLQQLDHSLQHSVTLIEAPAGFGKSTLLAQWVEKLAQKKILTAWLSMEESDDPDSLISHLAFAFHLAGLDMMESGLLSPHFKGEHRIVFALNELIAMVERSEQQTILMLDDFERTSNPAMDQIITRLLSNLPENLHLVIACRHNPGLSLSRLEISGMLCRINANDLRLGDEEIHKIFGSNLSDEEAKLILERTAGWPVVIQLLKSVCGDSPSDRQNLITNFTGASDQAATYFSEQLFDSLDQDQREFLIETSVLELVSPDAANYLRDRTDSHKLMMSLEKLDSLFPEVEPKGRVRRLHPLLREHLEANLAKIDKNMHMDLHCRVAQWAFDQGEVTKAISHAKKADNEELAGDFVERTKGLQIWINEGMDRLEGLLNLLSPGVLASFPRLILARAIIEMKKGHIRKARKFMAQAAAASKDFTEDRPGGDGQLLLTDRYLTESLILGYSCLPFHRHLSDVEVEAVLNSAGDNQTIRGFIITIDCLSLQQIGSFERSLEKSKEAIKAYRLANSLYGELFIHIHTGMVALAEGRMSDVKQLYKKATDISREHFSGDQGLKSILDACWAEYYWELGEAQPASRHIIKVPLAFENREAWFDVYMSAFRTFVHLKILEDDRVGLEVFFNAVLKHTRVEELERLENFLEALQISTFFDLKQEKKAIELYEKWRSSGRLTSAVWRENEVLCIAQARAMAYNGNQDAAIALLENFIQLSEKQGNYRNLTYGLYWVLNLADPIKQKTTIISAVTLLARSVERIPGTQVLKYICQIQSKIKDAVSCYSGPYSLEIAELMKIIEGIDLENNSTEPLLSSREVEVLKELSKGLSDKEIARTLDVTPNTIRFHLKNIYSKTGARNRIEALNHTSHLME